MTKSTPGQAPLRCYCDSGSDYADCCAPFIRGDEVPATAEQLMRSRYSAFVRCDQHYLLATWHPTTRPSRVRFNEQQHWLGLKVRATEAGGVAQRTGVVEFVARFKIGGRGHRLHERSRFEKLDGRWFYLDGQHL